MRLPPTILDVVLTLVTWTVVLWLVRRLRARAAADPSPGTVRGYRLHAFAMISATVGVTWFVVWLVTDTIGPDWLHALSLPATLIFIAVGAASSGYAGWVAGPLRLTGRSSRRETRG